MTDSQTLPATMRAAMAAADAVPATDEAPRPGIRARIGAAIMARLAAADREVVRRGAALFALPQHAATGSKLVWETADAVWTALGDSSDDLNWYTKRATLAAVYSATVLYWLGDTSEGDSATQEFLDRRLDDVMRIEKLKAQVRDNRLLSGLMAGPAWLAGRIRPPQRTTPAPAPENVQGDI
jgi:ubiquinone biosynthesis protein COQ9